MSAWRDLGAELDAWRAAGRSATLWWRDDDAAKPEPALDRLLELRRTLDVPLCLAVIPAAAQATLAEALAAEPGASVASHGYAHVNHAGTQGRKAEFGPERPLADMIGELKAGHERIGALFGAAARPILVPPWNRIAPALVPKLPEAGFRGLSTVEARTPLEANAGLVQVNIHADLIDWRGSGGFLGAEATLARIVAHLAARRSGSADADEPTGLLSHHLVHDEKAWDFLATYLERTRAHRAVRWLSAAAAFRLEA